MMVSGCMQCVIYGGLGGREPSHLSCHRFSIVWMDSTMVQPATALVSSTSRYPIVSINGLSIFDIMFTRYT